ncbi:MAG TPA: cyclic nucleotide-binding domain-containing protein [Candidatus Limnocylindria bacterium]
MKVEEQLAEVPLLAELDVRTRRRLAQQGLRRTYVPGAYIIKQGDPASAFYVVLAGRVSVEQESNGTVATLTELGPNAFFGEVALIESTPRTASVKALTETECLLLPAWEFTALLKEFPDVADVVLHELIRRMHRNEHQVL